MNDWNGIMENMTHKIAGWTIRWQIHTLHLEHLLIGGSG